MEKREEKKCLSYKMLKSLDKVFVKMYISLNRLLQSLLSRQTSKFIWMIGKN